MLDMLDSQLPGLFSDEQAVCSGVTAQTGSVYLKVPDYVL